MREKIEDRLRLLNSYREQVLSNYLGSLVNYNPKEGSLEAVEKAGLLHDLDKHITNLESELKRIELMERMSNLRVNVEAIHV